MCTSFSVRGSIHLKVRRLADISKSLSQHWPQSEVFFDKLEILSEFLAISLVHRQKITDQNSAISTEVMICMYLHLYFFPDHIIQDFKNRIVLRLNWYKFSNHIFVT